jgi:hypothetical protein
MGYGRFKEEFSPVSFRCAGYPNRADGLKLRPLSFLAAGARAIESFQQERYNTIFGFYQSLHGRRERGRRFNGPLRISAARDQQILAAFA